MTIDPSEVIRLLVADDEPLVRGGITMLLCDEPGLDVVGEVADGASAVQAAALLQPDVVLMDVRMPGTDGVEATRRLLHETPDDGRRRPAVLILTSFKLDDAVAAAVRAGASGFLLKHAAPNDLVRAVRAVHAGDGWLDPEVTRLLLKDVATRPEWSAPLPDELDQLTPREREVLTLVALGCSNEEIGQQLFVGLGTVKTHVSNVLMKLGVRDRTQAAAAAYRCGLLHHRGT